MRLRHGVSLPEVLVASVLLAIGVAGCLSALTTALRLRTAASARESLSAAAHDRLSWFGANGCGLDDSTLTPNGAPRHDERWQVTRDAAGVTLEGTLRGGSVGLAFDLHVISRVRCE